jgi:micrococcal nuclease
MNNRDFYSSSLYGFGLLLRGLGWRLYFLLLAIGIAIALVASADTGKVCSVHDGDTFKLCSGSSIRLAAVDAPELGQPRGREAREFARRYLMGREVGLACNGKSYKRRVCRVSVSGLDYGRELVGYGYAYSEPRYDRTGEYLPAQHFAQQQGRGVWNDAERVRPWEWRRRLRRAAEEKKAAH